MSALPPKADINSNRSMSHKLKLRAAKSADIPALMAMLAAMPEPQALPKAVKATAADWQRDLGHGFDATVAVQDGEIVGTAISSATTMPGLARPMTEVLILYVLESHRRQGIARALLDHVKQKARQHGSAFIRLAVQPDNAAALALYLDAGFRWSPHTLLLWPVA